MKTTKNVKPARKRRHRPHRPMESTWAPAKDLGPVLRVTLIGCGKAKAAAPKPARDLYTGTLFRAALEHAIATSDEVRIVSAKHGLVGLDDVLEPYDVRIEDLPVGRSRRMWGEHVVLDLVRAFPDRALDVTLLMGASYTDLLLPTLKRERVAWQRPLDGYPVGMRLWWFAREREERAKAEPPVGSSSAPAAVEPIVAEPIAPSVLIVGAGGQLELPHVGPLSRQLSLFA